MIGNRVGDTGSVSRGQLRVYLGSAPGVGKTYRMLDEGWRRHERGTDVVIGYVETHDRALTNAQIRNLELVPRVAREYRGARLEEMDLDAVLARHPKVALIDELAHTNIPGGLHAKRWEDVETLLDAGIDVITTVNIQHLESVNDVVEKITGISQQETIPDAIVRRAEQIELVDVTPEALRRRMAHGNIYSADKIDASLSNYFRVGNLSALRELALLWLADRVEDALQRYLDDHEINQTWETRERLIVGLTGTTTDEALLRRAARIASRTGAELFAVHVVQSDAMHHASADLTVAQELVKEFEGQFTEIVEDDIATGLVAFARSERGTQIVLGASRPRAPWRPPSGTVEKVLRHARDLDVHIIAVGGERPPHVHQRRVKSRVTWRRQALAVVATAAVMPILTVVMTAIRSSLSPSTVFLVYLLAVLALATWAGAAVGVGAAIVASGLENFYFVKPLHTLVIARPDDAVAIVAFLVFAVAASVLVNRFKWRTHEAERARAETEVLARAAASAATSHQDLLPLLDTLRTVFAASSVAVQVRRNVEWTTDVLSGDPLAVAEATTYFAIDEEHRLVVEGATLDALDQELVGVFASRVSAGLRSQEISRDADELEALAETEALRHALLSTITARVRRPLEEVQANIATLLDPEGPSSAQERELLLRDVESTLHRLSRVVTNVLDASRLEAGEIVLHPMPVAIDILVNDALATVDRRGRTIRVELPDDLPGLIIDAELVERVIANVVANACRFGPPEEPVIFKAGVVGDLIELLVIDQGPGMTAQQREIILAPFGRLRAEQFSAGLNLAVASGFIQLLGGRLHFEDTPGGGLTVAVELPLDVRASHSSIP